MTRLIDNDNDVLYLKEIQLLTFTLSGMKFGVDTNQIDEMLDPEQAEERQVEVLHFHEIIHFSKRSVSYRSPRVLLIKETEAPLGIVIEEPEVILSITIDQIQALPDVIALSNSSRAIWGAVVEDEEIVLLVDLGKSLAGRAIFSKHSGVNSKISFQQSAISL